MIHEPGKIEPTEENLINMTKKQFYNYAKKKVYNFERFNGKTTGDSPKAARKRRSPKGAL